MDSLPQTRPEDVGLSSQRLAHIGSPGAAYTVTAFPLLFPRLVNSPRLVVVVGAVKENGAIGIFGSGHPPQEVILGAPGLGENDCFLRRTVPAHCVEALFKSSEQSIALGIFADSNGQVTECFQIPDFRLDGSSVVGS